MKAYFYEYEKERNVYVVSVAMPGVKKENINIDKDGDGFLWIRVNGDNPFAVQSTYFTYMSRIDEEGIEAELKDGVLKITLPLKSKTLIAIK